MNHFPKSNVPSPDGEAVQRLCTSMHSTEISFYVAVNPDRGALPRECFANVRKRVDERGGAIQYGWAIWQYGDYFIEAEHHAVYVDPDGRFVDVTPQEPRVAKILFLPDDAAVYDPAPLARRDNHRVAILDDIRLHRLLQLFNLRVVAANAVQHVGAKNVPPGYAKKVVAVENDIRWLISDLVSSRRRIRTKKR